MEMDTLRELVRHYERNRCLWDPRDMKFFDKKIRETVWLDIENQMNISVKVLKEKMTSLMGSYRREKSREKRSSSYKSKWFAFDWFHFLIGREHPKRPVTAGDTVYEQGETSTRTNTEVEEDPIKENPTQRTSKRLKPTINCQQKRQNTAKQLQKIKEKLISAVDGIEDGIIDQQNNIDQNEDEFDLYGKLLAKKLRKLPPRDSSEIMYEIDGLILNRVCQRDYGTIVSDQDVNDPENDITYNKVDCGPNNTEHGGHVAVFLDHETDSLSPSSPHTFFIKKRSVSPCSPYVSPAPSPI